MLEAPKFRGLWQCPNYIKPINNAPPFEYACTGMEITEEGVAEFDKELLKAYMTQN